MTRDMNKVILGVVACGGLLLAGSWALGRANPSSRRSSCPRCCRSILRRMPTKMGR